jgi:hypothetical protein
LLLDIKPFWPTVVAKVLHTHHMIEVFEKEFKKNVLVFQYNKSKPVRRRVGGGGGGGGGRRGFRPPSF